MRVKILVNLKPSTREIISAGTIFDAPEEELPPWLLEEIKTKSRYIQVLSGPKETTKAKQAIPKLTSVPKETIKAEQAVSKPTPVSKPKTISKKTVTEVKPVMKKRGRPARRK